MSAHPSLSEAITLRIKISSQRYYSETDRSVGRIDSDECTLEMVSRWLEKELLFTLACPCLVDCDLCYPRTIHSCEALRFFHIAEYCYHTRIRRFRVLIPFTFIDNPYFQLCSPKDAVNHSSINVSRFIRSLHNLRKTHDAKRVQITHKLQNLLVRLACLGDLAICIFGAYTEPRV
jgi:hypothetical protein